MKKSHRDWVREKNNIDIFRDLCVPINWDRKMDVNLSPEMYKRFREEVKNYTIKSKPFRFHTTRQNK